MVELSVAFGGPRGKDQTNLSYFQLQLNYYLFTMNTSLLLVFVMLLVGLDALPTENVEETHVPDVAVAADPPQPADQPQPAGAGAGAGADADAGAGAHEAEGADVPDQGDGADPDALAPPAPSFDCYSTTDCPKYHWCRFTIVGNECASHMEERTKGERCEKEEEGESVADHSFCEEAEAHQTGEDRGSPQFPSVNRCFKELGYECANAYYMPCPSDVGCPMGFECSNQEFKDGKADVCVPKVDGGQSGNCSSHIDCGYSDLLAYWETCGDNNECLLIVQ